MMIVDDERVFMNPLRMSVLMGVRFTPFPTIMHVIMMLTM